MAVLSEVLGRSSTARRVLSLLVSTPGQELHTRDIARRVEADPHSTQLALEHLLSTGSVYSRRLGNLRLWSADPSSGRVRSIQGLLREESSVTRILEDGVSRMPGVKLALIFGSFASGSDRADSDIDALLVGNVDWDQLSDIGAKITAQVGRELNFVVWRNEGFKRPTEGQRRLLASVLSRPRILLKGDEHELIAAGRRLAATVSSADKAGPARRGRRAPKAGARANASRSR